MARDSAEHLSDETGRQLSRVEKQLKENQEALSQSSHEVFSTLSHHYLLLVSCVVAPTIWDSVQGHVKCAC